MAGCSTCIPKKQRYCPLRRPGTIRRCSASVGVGFSTHRLDAIEPCLARNRLPADGPIEWQKTFAGYLDRGYGAAFGAGSLNQPLRATSGFSRHVNMVTNQVQERIVLDEIASAPDRMRVSSGFGLAHKRQSHCVI